MTDLILKVFIKDHNNTGDPKVRTKYGILSGCVGIALNVLLCLMKFFVGSVTGSIAITADAVNNLSDAGSSAAAAAHTCVGIHWARSSNARKNDRNFTFLYMLFPPFSRFLPFLCAVTTV